LHVLRSLVTPPEYTLLPPYISQDDVDKYTSETRSSRYSIGASTPTASRIDRNSVPVGRVVSVATPAAYEGDVQRFLATDQKVNPQDLPLQSDERPVSPSSTISSIRYIPLSTLIERAQKSARVVIRKCNGIHIIAAGLETPITHYIYNIRLAVIQILLGLAYDTHIRAILTRMDLENQIYLLWSSERYNPHEAWSAPGTKCVKRLIALTRLCGPRLISLLSGSSTSQQSHSFLFSRPSMTASEALTILLKQNESIISQHGNGSIENQLIAANTQVIPFPSFVPPDIWQIRFNQQELLLLVKNYLLEEGLVATADLLTKESAGMVGLPAPRMSFPSPSSPRSPSAPTPHNKRSHNELVPKDEPPQSKALRSKRLDPFRISSPSHTKRISVAYHAPSPFDDANCVRGEELRISGKSGTPRRVSNQFATPKKHQLSSSQHRRGRGLSLIDGKQQHQELSHAMNTNGITLSGIINSYLRHQHQQCQHPVSIVPNFSLFEKHRCPAPPTSSNSLCDFLLQRRLFGDNRYRNRSYSFMDIHQLDCGGILKHRIFSEYRQWRIFQESQYDHISASAFSCDSRKVWIGGSSPQADGMERAGSLRLFDISTSQELGQWDFDHSIDNIVTPSLPDSQILMTTTGHGAIVDFLPTVSHQTNLWRTSAHSSSVTDYFLDPVPLVEWDDFCRPVFNSSNTIVAGISTQQHSHTISPAVNAVLRDVESGVELLTLTKSSPSQSTFITVPYKVPNVSFGLGNGGDNLLLADGILWDCRTGGIINDFDRLSHYGHGTFHPNGNSLLIDNVVWDMRKFSLLQTIKLLDGGFKTHFSTDDIGGSVLFGYNSRSLEHLVNEEYVMNPLNQPQNCFYTLDSTDYSLIHTFELDSDGTFFWGPIQSDPVGLGYLLTCEVRFDNVRRSMYDVMRESCCRVLEIGRRKPGIQDSDMDDAQTIDDEDWEVDEDGSEEDGGDDEDIDDNLLDDEDVDDDSLDEEDEEEGSEDGSEADEEGGDGMEMGEEQLDEREGEEDSEEDDEDYHLEEEESNIESRETLSRNSSIESSDLE
jgi:hypothetical protein